jgi:hypothetical protein
MTFDAMVALIDRAASVASKPIFRPTKSADGEALVRAVSAARSASPRRIGGRGTSRGSSGARMAGVGWRCSALGFRVFGAVPTTASRSSSTPGSAASRCGRGANDRSRRRPFDGTAVEIDGPAAHDLRLAFDHMWNRATGRERRGSHRFLRRKARGAHLDPATHTPALIGIVEGEPLRLRVSRALQIQAITATRSIWIATAYFIPSPSEIEALNGAARDGVDVRILVPSRNDHWWVSFFARRFYRRLLTNGVRIWNARAR